MSHRVMIYADEAQTLCCSELPLKLILRIFWYLRDDWLPEREVQESGKVVYLAGWMTVTHVCQRWREVRDSQLP